MKKTLSLLLSIFMAFSLLVFPVYAQEPSVVPTESDYTVSGTSITGLSQNFIGSLDSTQKQNIELIIPGTINGMAITKIADNAFKAGNYSTCKFIKLDLSSMTFLKTIGTLAFYANSSMQGNIILPDTIDNIASQAFEGCSSLTGDLTLPNSLTTIGSNAFNGCKGMKGNLVLSNQLKVISNYAFKDAGFTGQLNIPSSVEKICDSAFRQSSSYKGFSGKLIIPDSVTVVEKVAFSYQDSITDVQFSKNMTSIPQSMFNYCKGLEGVLRIPDHIQSIGATAFANSNLKTVYLPKMLDQSNINFIQSNSFNPCSNLTVIVGKEEDYSTLTTLLSGTSSVLAKLSYEVDIQLKDKNGNIYNPTLKKLYNQKYGFVKQEDDSWGYNSGFQFPEVTINNVVYKDWAISEDTKQPITVTSLVGNEKSIFPIKKLEDPVITFSDNVDKVYDGQPAVFSVNAYHPDAVSIGNAKEGDIVFYYTWRFATIGSSPAVLEGFDKNSYSFSDVRQPDYDIILGVSVMACRLENKNGKLTAVAFKTVNHDFGVRLRQADAIVNPVYKGSVQLSEGLPDIQLSNGDTDGTLTWDANQSLQEGTHSYTWTFTPSKNDVGSSNYKVMKGSVEVTAYQQFHIGIKNNGHGKVSPSESYQVKRGEDTLISFTPDKDFHISSLKIDGKESLSQLIQNQLTLKNIQTTHEIEVTFTKNDVGVIEDIVTQLPGINEGEVPTQEQITNILEAKLIYETLGDVKADISLETKKAFNELLAKLPQVKVSTESPVIDNCMLLDNMSIEDVEILLNDPQATLSIDCELKPISSQQMSNEFKDLDKSIKLSECFDIQMIKKLSTNGNDAMTSLTHLSSPIQVSFVIPKNLPQLKENYKREYYIVRIHENGQDKEITVLNNESLDDSQIIVTTDRFSLYAIAYKDVEITNKPQEPDISIDPEQPEIIKPFNPNTSTDHENVQTGDEQNLTIWIALGTCSLIAGAILIFYKKKK